MFTEESAPDDNGAVRLKIDAVNSGSAPRIHYQEDGPVGTNSPVLSENVLITKALRVQFMAVDPSGKNQTGAPVTWTNRLTIRNCFDENTRKLEIIVTPKGMVRYTLDGSEARNGTDYTQPITLGDSTQSVYVFAECDGIEEKRTFQFAARGETELEIIKDKPAQMSSPTPKRLDSSAKTYEGLKLARDRGITFEQVTLQIGSSPKVIHLSLGEMQITAAFLEKELANLQTLLPPDAPVIMSFKKAHTPTGFDLEQFAKNLGIELKTGEVIQV